MNTQRFTAIIAKYGTKTIIPIPFNPNDVWGVKQRHHITGLVNGMEFRGSILIEGSQFFLALGPAWCRDCSLEAGVEVNVTLSPEGPQIDQMPPDIVSALDAEPQARLFFESLATFYRTAYIKWIEGTKKRPEVRSERIQEMIMLLKTGKKQK
jgi:hypothetical protein